MADLENTPIGWIFAVAVVLRAVLLPVPPSLSDDIYRYVWDGRVVSAGLDPYALSPDADELAGLRDDLWERLPHRDVATVYPPLALWSFSIASRSANPVVTLKAILAVADLISCFLLWRIAVRTGRRPGRAAWYAWCPLVTLEVAGMGHVDALGVPWVLLGLLALSRPGPIAVGRRWGVAVVGAAGAILVKLVPVLCVPLWSRRTTRPVLFVAAVGLVSASIALPVMTASGVPKGLVRYGVSWEFNGPLYEPLWRALETARAPALVERLLDSAKQATDAHDFWNRFYPLNYARLHAKLLLAALLGAAVLRSLSVRDPVEGSGRLLGAIVLVSATVYPWYLLWLLPWAALDRVRPWLALSVLIFLSYLPQITDVPYMPWIYLAIWVPFLVLWLLWARGRRGAARRPEEERIS